MVQLFPVAIFSQIFHHSIPGLVKPIRHKQHVNRIFLLVLLTTFFLYTLVGEAVALYYGSSTSQTCSLDWADYRGGASADESVPGWASFLSYMVVLFPVFDILSAFPLNAITLANNIMARVVRDPHKRAQRRYIVPFRLAAALPPLVGACLVSDLGTILSYAGCVGILIAFLFPCLLQFWSVRRCRAALGTGGELTPYTTSWSARPALLLAFFAVSCVSFVLVLVFSFL